MSRPAKERSIDIFVYLNYRHYLRDVAKAFKKNQAAFTLQDFAKRAGLKSPGLLKMVIDGKRNLTEDSARAFCKAFDIAGKAGEYFQALVHYNQTDDPDERAELFEKLRKMRPRSHSFSLEKKHQRYLSHDYYAAIREMVLLNDFREDPKWIGERLNPKISAGDVSEALELLLEIGLLKRDECGKLVQAEAFVHTKDGNTQALEAVHFHDAVLKKARFMLGYLEQEKRSYYALTLPLPKNMVGEIIDDFYALRDKIVAKINQAGLEYDDVYQLNFQFFPLTQKKDETTS